MEEWITEEHTDYLDNAVVLYKYRDGIHIITEIRANDSYALADVNYTPEYDADDNEIPRLYHRVICAPPSVDYNLYESVPITEYMEAV